MDIKIIFVYKYISWQEYQNFSRCPKASKGQEKAASNIGGTKKQGPGISHSSY